MIVIAASLGNLLLLKLLSPFFEMCFMLTCFQNSIIIFVKNLVQQKFTVSTNSSVYLELGNNLGTKRNQVVPVNKI